MSIMLSARATLAHPYSVCRLLDFIAAIVTHCFLRPYSHLNAGFLHEVTRVVGEPHCQFPRRQLGLAQRHLDDLVMDIRRDPVPHPARR